MIVDTISDDSQQDIFLIIPYLGFVLFKDFCVMRRVMGVFTIVQHS
jgi:hypothetical protein